jgi:hypothetical protein
VGVEIVDTFQSAEGSKLPRMGFRLNSSEFSTPNSLISMKKFATVYSKQDGSKTFPTKQNLFHMFSSKRLSYDEDNCLLM